MLIKNRSFPRQVFNGGSSLIPYANAAGTTPSVLPEYNALLPKFTASQLVNHCPPPVSEYRIPLLPNTSVDTQKMPIHICWA